MKTGFIGFGSMGRMLVKGLVSSGALSAGEVVVSSRSDLNGDPLLGQLPGIEVAGDNIACAEACRRLFLCVKPLDLEDVLSGISAHLSSDMHLVSIAACVTMENLEKRFSGAVTRVIPSYTAEHRSGISLICHNLRVSAGQSESLEAMLRVLGDVEPVDESNFEAAADLTSCAPGLISAIFREFAAAGVRHSSLDSESAKRFVRRTLYGTSLLFEKGGEDFEQIIKRVATPGGITGEGVKILDKMLPDVYDRLFEATLSKHEEIKSRVADLFNHSGTE